jgi:hypothetical protein
LANSASKLPEFSLDETAKGEKMLNRGGSASDQEQFFAVPANQVWTALEKALPTSGLRIKKLDPSLMRAEFSSGMTAMTWGQNFVATIQPGPEEGCLLKIGSVGKFPGPWNRSRSMKVCNDLIGKISSAVQS